MLIILFIYIPMGPLYFRTINQQAKPCLEKLKADPDADVSYFAGEAMTGRFSFI